MKLTELQKQALSNIQNMTKEELQAKWESVISLLTDQQIQNILVQPSIQSQNHLMKIYIGDWSDDGHGKCDEYYFVSNYNMESIREAYKQTCQKIGLQLHMEKDFTGLVPNPHYGSWRYIATEYEDDQLREEVMEILIEHGCTLYGKPLNEESDPYLGSEEMFELFMWFVSYSMPKDFHYEKLEVPSINGWGEFNFQIGYGCFS